MVSKKKRTLLVYALAGAVSVPVVMAIIHPGSSLPEGNGLNLDLPEERVPSREETQVESYRMEDIRQSGHKDSYDLEDYCFPKEDAKDTVLLRSMGTLLEEISREEKSQGMKTSLYEVREADCSRNYLEDLFEKREPVRKESPSGFEEKVALMEKSYELASRYGASKGEVSPREETAWKEEPLHTSISAFRKGVTSSLDENGCEEGFLTAEGMEDEDWMSYNAVIYGEQTILDGDRITMKTTRDLVVNGTVLPCGTILYGYSRIEDNRVYISVRSIPLGDTIRKVSLSVYDTDNQKGIHSPVSSGVSAAREIGSQMSQRSASDISISGSSSISGVAATAGRTLVEGVARYISKKASEVRVTIADGYRITINDDSL